MNHSKDTLKWPAETRSKIENLVEELRQFQSDAKKSDNNALNGGNIEDRWRKLLEKAQTLYQESIGTRLGQFENVMDDDWPELDELHADDWPVYSPGIPGPEWIGDLNAFDEFSGDESFDEIVFDEVPGHFADKLAQLLVRQCLFAVDRKMLEKYSRILRARLELVEGMLG